jgi:hypothetical protein
MSSTTGKSELQEQGRYAKFAKVPEDELEAQLVTLPRTEQGETRMHIKCSARLKGNVMSI